MISCMSKVNDYSVLSLTENTKGKLKYNLSAFSASLREIIWVTEYAQDAKTLA